MNNDPNTDPSGGDWWSTNAPPVPTGPVTDPNDPRLTDGRYASDPNVLDFLNKQLAQQQVASGNAGTPNTPDWQKYIDPAVQAAQQQAVYQPPTGQPPPSGGPAPTLPGAPINFGAAPPTYAAPTWDGGAPPSAPVIPKWTAPTIDDLFNSPGFQSRFQTGQTALERGAAARGTVLNGGTQKALARYGQDYASNEYSNLVNQSLAGAGFNAAQQQTQFGDAFSNYQARYGQFSDAAAMGKGAFDTNVTNTRNTDLDYWGRLNDLYQTGANSANNSYKPGA